jgi:hypothetical protein
MVERSRSGAYIPVGKVFRSQLEATSPWSFAERAKRLHAEDVCPDCAAEQSMKRHESVKAREDTLQAASHSHRPGSSAPPPGPLLATAIGPVPVPAADLIRDTGTIVVVQHEGILDRLAVDPRRNPLDRASTQRLSENLAKASKAVAELGSVDEHPVQTTAEPEQMHVQEPKPQPLRPLKIKSCSMSELLDDLHAIAADMNIDLSGPAKDETFVQTQGYMTPIQSPSTGFFDAEGLLSEPTTPGITPAKTDPIAETQEEPHYTCGRTPEPSLPHVEDTESLLSEPTSPGPMSDEALAKAIAEHVRNHASSKKSPSPPSAYVTALPTRNNSIRDPIPLPSSILRATDYSPTAAGPVTHRPSSRVTTSPLTSAAPRFVPGNYPMSPGPPSPWSIQSPKPTKRVRTMNRWPSEPEISPPPESPTSDSDQAYIATELHKAVQEVAARERDLHRAIKEAAEMERDLRRKVMARRRVGGASKG